MVLYYNLLSVSNTLKGSAIETKKCGSSFSTSWDCLYGKGVGFLKDIVAEMPEVQAEVGTYCRCGCVVHLGLAKPTRLLATSSQSCPGRTFWLIQADPESLIQFRVLQFHLTCRTQSLKIRDGNALSSNLLAHLSSVSDTVSLSVNSTGSNLLLEFFSVDTIDTTNICGGGFIAQASQIRYSRENVTVLPVTQNAGIIPILILKLTAVHIAAIFFLSGLLIATVLLGIQYIFRYRKYQIAEADEKDTISNYSTASVPLATRVSSNATLLSEVISLTKFRPHLKLRNKHTRLRESVDCETLKSNEEATLAKQESLSICSTTTLTQEETLAKSASTVALDTAEAQLTESCHSLSTLKRSSTMESDKDKSDEKEPPQKEYRGNEDAKRRPSNINNVTLTNVSLLSKIHSTSDPGCYSSGENINKATIKSTSIKETKEKRNREKLMAGPNGSDFSISGQDNDLEMDYYDYNVVNAGAAPGSYLGMDPAFLVWIPPLDEDGEIFSNYDSREYHEMTAVREYADPGSNKESPEEEETLLPKHRKARTNKESPIPKLKFKASNSMEHRGEIDNKFISEVQPLVHKIIVDSDLPDIPKKLKETKKYIREDMEKETEVEKSLDLGNVENIKFVDDEEMTDTSVNQCNIDRSYQDSNIISSS